jgi:hypothetical protein
MQFHPRRSSVLPSLLGAAGIMLALTACSGITPLGPDPGYVSLPAARQLGSPIIVQVMRSQSHPPTSGCPAGSLEVFLTPSMLPHAVTTQVRVGSGPVPTPGASTAAPPPGTSTAAPAPGTSTAAPAPASQGLVLDLPCYHPVGTPVRITSAAVSSVSAYPVAPGPHQGPAPYGFTVGVPGADVAAVTALIRQAYDSHAALGISVAGRLWEAPQVSGLFSGQQLKIAVFTRTQAVRLYRLLIPSG